MDYLTEDKVWDHIDGKGAYRFLKRQYGNAEYVKYMAWQTAVDTSSVYAEYCGLFYGRYIHKAESLWQANMIEQLLLEQVQ